MTQPPEGLAAQLRKKPFARPGEKLIVGALGLCAAISVLTTVAIVITLFSETLSFFDEVSLRDFFLKTDWAPQLQGTFGVWELVAGTVNVVIWSMLISLPLGLAAAIYLSEYAHPRTRKALKPLLEALAGVPTIVYAFFALTFVTEDFLRPALGEDRVPYLNSLSASIVLAIMVLPTIASVSEDAMSNVPRALREAAYGLGATRLEVATRVVLPAAISGVLASVLLAVARVVGETMIVAIAAGSNPALTLNPLATIQTMTGYMLQIGLGDAARGTVDYSSIFAVGALLFSMTFILNVGAQLVVRRFREVYE
ncbi:MAG: phosphate ABC transporter permease subunit PstC [Dehalococcoidia bacterium]|nr:phosphate ABC transporter permease subunit PstC [Dehalococcoidia bacterium]